MIVKTHRIVITILLMLAMTAGDLFADDRPNVLVILADDLGFSDLGCYGSEIPTPNLDGIAAAGAKFDSFYTSARCCPSRASLMTGLHPHQAGIGSFATRDPKPNMGPAFTGHLLDSCVTLAEILGDAGYSTWMVGKWHMGIPGPIDRGFQNYYGYKNFLAYAEDQWSPDKYVRLPEGTTPELKYSDDKFYATDVFSDYAVEFLDQACKMDKPFFLYLAHSSPHFPVQAPGETIAEHVDTYRKGWDTLRAERLDRQKKLGLFKADAKLPPRSMVPVDNPKVANNYGGQPNPAWDSFDADRRDDLAYRMATFAAMVEHVDDGVGRIVKTLEQHEKLDNTIIVFLSDNGACYEWGPFGFDGPSRRGITTLHTGDKLKQIGQPGSHNSYGSAWANLCNSPLNMYKHFCHEGGLSSPLLVSWPKRLQPAAQWIRTPAHLMDIVPTVLDATGAKYPETYNNNDITPVEGTSLLPAIKGKAMAERSIPFDHQGAHGLRRGPWKIVWSKRQPTEVKWMLFNLETDRSEQHDLAAEKPELLAELVAEWETWARKVGVAGYYKGPKNDAVAGGSAQDDSPQIANQPLTLVAEVQADELHGVVMAQGGNQYGYALHFEQGVPIFDVRIKGEVTRLKADKPVKGMVRLDAKLTKDTLSLSVNGAKALTHPSPGLIPIQPIDGLSIGFDDRTAAGDYDAPNKIDAMIFTARVDVAGKPPAVKDAMPRSEIEAGFKSHDRALYVKEGWIRDPYIVTGPDGWFYLTGTTPNPGEPREKSDPYNTGLGVESLVGWKANVWRSRDLIDWQSLGTPFTLKDGIWFKEHPDKFDESDTSQWRLWAPELHWIGDRWALVHTSPTPVAGANLSLTQGAEVKGPWSNPMGAKIQKRHDPSLFQDDDGTWWMIWGATSIAPLKPDFSDFADKPTHIRPSGETAKMGHEGCLIQKIYGKYVLFGTGWSTGKMRKGSYNLYYATADKITGPYSERKFAGRFLGHGTPFRDQQGRWWCTAFYNANIPPLSRAGIETRDLSNIAQTINHRGTTIVPLEVKQQSDGDIYIRAKDPAYATIGPDEAQKFD